MKLRPKFIPQEPKGPISVLVTLVTVHSYLAFRFTVDISLTSCSSRKEKLGSNTPANFITSWMFSLEVEPADASAVPPDSLD